MYRLFFILGILCIYLSPMCVEAKVLGYWNFNVRMR